MEIVEIPPKWRIAPMRKLALVEAALTANADKARLHLDRARILLSMGRLDAAAAGFEAAIARWDGAFPAWHLLAKCRRHLGQPDAVLAICDGQAGTAALALEQGYALRALNREREAAQAFERARACDPGLHALNALLTPLAQTPDAAPLLDRLDSLPPQVQATAEARAYRAIAFSKLGRVGDARALIDLDRCIVRMAVTPPEDYQGIDDFNAAIAREALTRSRDTDADISYLPPLETRPALAALFRIMTQALTDYAARIGERGLGTALPPPPARAALRTGITMLRGQGHNGAHIHPLGYVSSVYHALVPSGLKGDHGALTIGGCETQAGGHHGCWGVRTIPAVAGWLTLFPSHVFHDVVPTGIDAPRISIVADLEPLIDGQPHPEIAA